MCNMSFIKPFKVINKQRVWFFKSILLFSHVFPWSISVYRKWSSWTKWAYILWILLVNMDMTEFCQCLEGIWGISWMVSTIFMNISNLAIQWWGNVIFLQCSTRIEYLLHVWMSDKSHFFSSFLLVSTNSFRAPSFFCENETRHGLTLHYRTKRKGFVRMFKKL